MPPTPPHGLDVLRTYGTGFAGRQAELEALDRAWSEGVRVFVLHAQGGAGKTRVVAKWLTQVGDDGWRGAGRVFVHSFYSQGSDERRNASSEIFFAEALTYFGHAGPPLTDPGEKGKTLARLVGELRGLLVLDGLEPLQQPPAFDQGRLKDPAIQSLLSALAAGWVGEAVPRGMCLVTSRQPVVELESKTGSVVVQRPLEELDPEAGAELLRQLEVAGPEKELRQASQELRGHAYTLMLLGTYLRDATPDHEIRRRAEIPLLQEDAEHGNHARHLFAAYVRHLGESSPEIAVLRLLGFFDRPAEERLMVALREADEPELDAITAPVRDLSAAAWRRLLRRLSELRLINVPTGPSPPLDAHPLLRESFAEQVRTDFPSAWQAGHRRLFKVLCTTTEHRPGTLAGLQPLYQAVAHGCLAGLHQEALEKVYKARILRGTGDSGHYSSKVLGAIGADLGAVMCFFTVPWTTFVSKLSPLNQAWLLNEAAYRLGALSRLNEAVEPMKAAVEMWGHAENWEQAAICANNLSELELMRGEVAAAVIAGEQAVVYADRSGVEFLQISIRTSPADALHQAGRRAESRGLFEAAEALQATSKEYPCLYSVAGARYCDLLLANAERAAWHRWFGSEAGLAETLSAAEADCVEVLSRAIPSLFISTSGSVLLSMAMDNLTLAQIWLYGSDFTAPIPSEAHQHITAAVECLRASGQMDALPRGLLTRAWLLCLSGDEAGGRADLEEAWEIAERGPMPLFQADVLLARARLFRDREALAEARRLIEKHGYHRRDEELADAEAAAAEWGLTPRPPLPSPSLPPGEGAPPPSREEARMADEAVRADGGFDVFLSHNGQDKPMVREIKRRLAERGVKAWLDMDELQPGIPWQEGLEEAIQVSRSVAVFLGGSGIGPWANEEMAAALVLAVQDRRPVIPVLLPEAPDGVKVPMFLGNRTWVDLRPDAPDGALDRLVWGITGKRPGGR